VAVKGLFFEIFYFFFHLLCWTGQYPSAVVFCVAFGKSAITTERNILVVQMAAIHFCKAMHFTQNNMNKLSQNANELKMVRILIRMKSVKSDANQHMLDKLHSVLL